MLTVPAELASAELQNGFWPFVGVGEDAGAPIARLPKPIKLTNASAVPERSDGLQTCVSPPGQLAHPAEKRFDQCLTRDRRTAPLQSKVPS